MSYQEQIEENRAGKDKFMAKSEYSPLPKDQRGEFNGLHYFPIDESFKFELKMKEYSNPEKFESSDSAGNPRSFYRVGEFLFTIDAKEYSLQAYKAKLSESGLFIPFKDKSNTKTTYGAGRYLDLHEQRDKKDDGIWILDFNTAYNPFCAYSDSYACALTPSENYLEVEILAGEKIFH